MPISLTADSDGTQNDDAQPARVRGLLPLALQELQASVEELRVADEEMRVQNEELSLSRQRLEAERQRYQDLFDFAPDGYLVTTAEGIILEANRAASRLLGISTRFLKKRSLGTLIAVPDLGEFQSRLKSLNAPAVGPFGEWTVQLRRRPSGKFSAAVTAALYQGALGQPPTVRWLIRDITGRVQAEEERAAHAQAEAARAEMEEVQRRTSEILEVITDTYVAVDSEWRITALNASAMTLTRAGGLDPAALIGQILWDVDPTPQGKDFEAETMRAVASGQTVEFEAFSEKLGRWFHVRVFPTQEGASLYANDITDRKDAEAVLKAAYERERRIAETLQQTLVHTPAPSGYSGLQIETFYEAASDEAAIGGDFFDVFTYDRGKIALVVGDVSGKGLGAATLIAEVKFALRTILREAGSPEAALPRLNDFFCEAQAQGDFASDNQVVLSLATFDPDTGSLSYVTAGGEPLLLLRADGTAEVIGANGLLLGVMANVAYTASSAQVAPGDTFLMVTDGLTEARRDGRLFGFETLQAQAVQLLPSGTLREFGQALLDSARHWTGGAFGDDICLLLARCPPG